MKRERNPKNRVMTVCSFMVSVLLVCLRLDRKIRSGTVSLVHWADAHMPTRCLCSSMSRDMRILGPSRGHPWRGCKSNSPGGDWGPCTKGPSLSLQLCPCPHCPGCKWGCLDCSKGWVLDD